MQIAKEAMEKAFRLAEELYNDFYYLDIAEGVKVRTEFVGLTSFFSFNRNHCRQHMLRIHGYKVYADREENIHDLVVCASPTCNHITWW